MSMDENIKSDQVQKEGLSDSGGNDYGEPYDHVEEKRLVRKVDWRLLPILGALYSIALIDRTNVSTLVVQLSRERDQSREPATDEAAD